MRSGKFCSDSLGTMSLKIKGRFPFAPSCKSMPKMLSSSTLIVKHFVHTDFILCRLMQKICCQLQYSQIFHKPYAHLTCLFQTL